MEKTEKTLKKSLLRVFWQLGFENIMEGF